ncbi:glucosaminidase [Vibrio sp. 10N.286.49.C2]|uniref:glucosaminidase domain-containing protein n=1 Tax=unclassified Vibrio TaxID=2614977 RepID=UPI000C83E166|nr:MULTISPECIES: glucosaminidase domain-containing protein [unclassified Vibrio]PMH36395.1 glucosaminidase [Vibrio sp. 10N.286.49.C2]PMH49896.1 glucosaminidase [Vibrio sp. 10N.286.49.B1]PMH82312.1 glucosaminidase [Vibrio sp. 10N.286.48.B7]
MRKSHTLMAAAVLLSGSTFLYLGHDRERSEDGDVSEPALVPISDSPPDIAAITDTKTKKQTFFDYLRPGIEIENARIEKERQRILRFKNALDEQSLTQEQIETAKRLGRLYNLEPTEVTYQWIEQLLHRVDVLPEALVLTQAANESAWGTSRFAKEANNYFGQWCYSKGCGVVPLQRGTGKSHEVAKFSSPQESIYGYFMNVNRNNAYAELRTIRSQIRDEGQSPLTEASALKLTNGLLRYSERGEAYVKDLQAMIRHNEEFWISK